MGLSIKDLENVGKNLERSLERRSEERAQALLARHGVLGLAGVLLTAPFRIMFLLGGLAAAFFLGFILSPRVVSVTSADDLILAGAIVAGVYWFFVIRRFPLLGPVAPMAVAFWILTHGGI